MEHCTYIVHQDKMAVLAEVSKSTVTFESDVFRKNTLFTIAQNSTLNTIGVFGFTCDLCVLPE